MAKSTGNVCPQRTEGVDTITPAKYYAIYHNSLAIKMKLLVLVEAVSSYLELSLVVM